MFIFRLVSCPNHSLYGIIISYSLIVKYLDLTITISPYLNTSELKGIQVPDKGIENIQVVR